jgi:tetratricopeptide (TPR) repeat protein
MTSWPTRPVDRRSVRRWACFALLPVLLQAPLLPAADCANPRKATGSMSESVYRGVENATDLISKQKYAEAIEKLTRMAESGGDYEKAIVYYNLGYAHNAKGDTAGAAKAFARALSFNALPQAQHDQLQYNLGQLYIVSGDVDEGIRTLQTYVSESCSPVSAQAHIFLANALSTRKRFQEALPQIEQGIAKAKAPKESWLQLKLAIAYEIKDYKACAQTLVQLIGIAPVKQEYWKQLSSMFYEMKQDTEALAVLALAERQGFIDKPNERRNLYNIYMMLDLPYKAGVLLQDSIDKGKLPADEKNLESLADAWLNSRELPKAEAALKKLASTSGRGEHFYKLGGMYGDDERWKESKEMLERALQKGGLKHMGEAWMRLAVACYNLKDLNGAQVALRKASDFDESRKQASEWLRHLSGQSSAEQQPALAQSDGRAP